MTQPSASLPRRPSLALLSSLAKSLRKTHEARDPQAIARIKANHPRFASSPDDQIAQKPITLRDAQLVIAREYGFEHWAAMKKHVESLQNSAADDAKLRALISAAAAGDLAGVKAALHAHPDLIDELGGDNRAHNQFKTTALHRAAAGGHLEVVRLLLDRGADPDIRDEGDNGTPLHFAAELGSLPIVKLLVERGADVNGFGDLHNWDVIGWATLHWAMHTEVAEYLLENGAKHNIFSAIAMGDVDAIKSLAEVSRDVMDKPMAIWESRRRPLHLAILKKQPAVVPVLLDLGADVEATDIDDLTPLDFAALRGESEIVQTLLDRGAKIHAPAAFALQKYDVIRAILADDPDILKPGHRWARLLTIASGSSAPGEVIESLLAHGASVDALFESRAFGTKGYTPLHEAAFFGNLKAIEVLIKHGARLDVKDATYHATPLGWATYAKRTKAAELLKSLGAVE